MITVHFVIKDVFVATFSAGHDLLQYKGQFVTLNSGTRCYAEIRYHEHTFRYHERQLRYHKHELFSSPAMLLFRLLLPLELALNCWTGPASPAI